MIDKSAPVQRKKAGQLPLPKQRKRSKTAVLAILVSLIALFFTAAGIAAGYKHWQRMHAKVKANQKEVIALKEALASKSSIEDLRAEVGSLIQDIKQREANQQSRFEAMQALANKTEQFAGSVDAQVAKVTQLQGDLQRRTQPARPKTTAWIEVGYLLRMAQRELYLGRNVGSALKALKQAESKLGGIGEVSYLPLRQQIGRDLGKLSAWEAPDVNGILRKIDMLNHLVGEPRSRARKDDESGQDKGFWSSWRAKLGNVFEQSIIVRNQDDALIEQMDSDARGQLSRLWQLRLETLRLFVLQADQQGFSRQLKQLDDLSEVYFDPKLKSQYEEVRQSLTKVNLQPTLPDISGSLGQYQALGSQ